MNNLWLEKITCTVILQLPISEDVFNTWLFEKFRYQMPFSLVEKIKKSKQSERISIKFPSSGAYSVYLIFCFCIGEFCGIENIASLWKPRREDGWQKKCVSVVKQSITTKMQLSTEEIYFWHDLEKCVIVG